VASDNSADGSHSKIGFLMAKTEGGEGGEPMSGPIATLSSQNGSSAFELARDPSSVGFRCEAATASQNLPKALRADAIDFYDEEMIKLYWAIQKALPVGGSGERARGRNITSRIVEVISANPGAGASTVAWGLAETAATYGSARVLVCSVVSSRRRVRASSRRAGLNDVAAGRIALDEVITPMSSGKIGFCVAGNVAPGSSMAVDMEDLDPVFSVLREQYDLILMDAPATSRSFLGAVLSKRADGVILIVEAGRTRVPVAVAARRSLEANGANILGIVLNKRRLHIPRFIYRFI
jgi:Mrp family chromosome partitioning ATPase